MVSSHRSRARFLATLLSCVVVVVVVAPIARAASDEITPARDGARRGGEEITFAVEHSLDESTFAPAGVVTGKLAVDRNDARNFRLSSPRATRAPLGRDETEALNALIARDGVYRVRVPSNIVSAREGSYVMASVPAKCMASSGLVDALTVHTDDRGNAHGIEYTTANGDCEDGSAKRVKVGAKFRTTVYVRVPKDAPGLNPDAPTDVRGHGAPANEQTKREAKQRRRARENSGGENGEGSKKEREPPAFMQNHWLKIMFCSYVFAWCFSPPTDPAARRAAAQRRVNAVKKRQD